MRGPVPESVPLACKNALKNSVKTPAIVGIMFIEKIGLTLAVLSLCGLGHAESEITSDTYFYGESPAVYPSRMFPSFFPRFVLVMLL